jgi:O-antigen ligase
LLLVGLVRVIRHVGLEWLAIQLMGLGVGLALFGIVQKAMLEPESTLVYGFWLPRHGGSPFGPFINRNHFAGWMVMVLPLVIGYSCAVGQLARHPQGRGWRVWLRWLPTLDANRVVLVAVSVIVMAGALVFTSSRSGTAAFAVSLAVLGLLIVRRTSSRRVRLVSGSYFLVVLVGVMVWTGADRIAGRFQRAPVEIGGRVQAWKDTLEIVKDFPLSGTGLGTYHRAMLAYQTEGRDRMYAQAHNDYLQLAAEGGLLVVVPAIVLLVVLCRGIWRRMTAADDDPMTGWIRAGAVAGLCGIAAQSLVEFSLQMPGNAVTCVLLLAVALHRPGPGRSSHAHRV